jgi:2-oxoglutarate ferredoxin oxidoreductase subunit gamma
LVANVLGLGLLVKTSKIVSMESIQRAIEEEVPQKVLDLNLEALQYGYSLVEKTYSLKDEKRRAAARFE